MVKLFRIKSLLLLAVLFSDPAHCIQDSDFHSSGADESHNYARNVHLKLRGLFDIPMGDWKGEEWLEASTESVGSGKSFCAISFSKKGWHGYRHGYKSRDYELKLRGPTGYDGHFVLRNNRGKIPISFSLEGKGRSVLGEYKRFLSNDSIYIHSFGGFNETCNDYSFLLTAELFGPDIFERGFEGRFRDRFEVEIRDVRSGLTIRKSFRVSVHIRKTFMISGLHDVYLDVKNVRDNWLYKDMDFCVHVLNGGHYRINIQGQNNPNGDLILKNGQHALPYRMSFQSTHNSRWFILNKSGYAGWYFGGSRSLDCDGGSNAVIRVEIESKHLKTRVPGSYSDVVEVTVGAK